MRAFPGICAPQEVHDDNNWLFNITTEANCQT